MFVLKVTIFGFVSLALLFCGGVAIAAAYSVVVEDMIATEDISVPIVVFPSLIGLLVAPVLASGLLLARKVSRVTRKRMSSEPPVLR